MPEYRYVARNEIGVKVEGVLDAANESEAAATISTGGLFPISISPVIQQVVTGNVRRVKGELLAAFYSQLSDLLRGGVPLLRSLKILHDQTSNINFKFVLDNVYRRVESGDTLSDAMGRYQVVFGEMGVQMVRAGSEGGFLEESLNHVAAHTEAQDDLRGRIIGALVYPVLLFVFMVVIVLAIMVFIVPKFEVIFNALRSRGELPVMTEWLLFISNRMTYILPILTPLIFIGFVWYSFWRATDRGRWTLDRLKLRVPVAGKVYEGFAIARFCRVLGTLLKNGVPIVKSLDIAGDAIGNKILLSAIQKASEKISSGMRLATPLAESGCFPKSLTEMIAVAEESNTLDSVLISVSDSLEKRNWRSLDLAVKFIEPVMLILLGLIVLFLVMALLLPMLNMANIAN
ncbi:MAG: type II secretion system F family protein [Planctomycetaceae bacterium]|jgi:general secretion pathway protein F/type IV pilus assembly protein PilC|nr:type II secretion system F family protein [Planctomycetaceae bacterium]